jgi:hypothetical protein
VQPSNEHERPTNPALLLKRAASASAASLRPADIFTLQRAIGNRAVGRFLANQPNAVSPQSSNPSNAIQRKTEEVEPLQAKLETDRRGENRTGLPDKLKAGIERLSGMMMGDLRVHYNSSAPARVQALAFTQGTDIHIGPNEERHLPHEAWHAVQQKQGRVKPTLQAKGLAINDDRVLEREADVMGARTSQVGTESLQRKETDAASLSPKLVQLFRNAASNPPVLQLVKRTPTYTGANHSTKVELEMDRGDTLDAGSEPSVLTDGYAELATLGLTQGVDAWHQWIEFHVLNEKAGGSGATKANLTPATQKANHNKDWNKFEKNLKELISPERGGNAVVIDKVKFKADVGYYDAKTIYWKKNDGSTTTTDSSHYPKSVDATLTATWAEAWAKPQNYKANLDKGKGLIKPEELETVTGWGAYEDAQHKQGIKGDVK